MPISLLQQRALQDVHGMLVWKALVCAFLLVDESTVAQLLFELGTRF